MRKTAIGSWRLRSSGEHCHRELAVEEEEEREKDESRRRRTRGVDIKSNSPHLTGWEKPARRDCARGASGVWVKLHSPPALCDPAEIACVDWRNGGKW